jgi:hypothetical protein
MKYVFKIYYSNDDENVWISANSKQEAVYQLKSEYPRIKDYVLLRIDK